MEKGGEASISEAVTAESVVSEHRPHDESPKNVDHDSSIAIEDSSVDTGLVVAIDSTIPRNTTGRSMSALDEKLDILIEEIANGIHISSVDHQPTPNSEQAPREEKNESSVVTGYRPLLSPVSPYTSEPKEKDIVLDSANYTHRPSEGAYVFDTLKEQDEILQSLTPFQSTYSQHQSPLHHPENGPCSSLASLGSFGHQDISGNQLYRVTGGSDISSTDRGSNVQESPYSDRRDLNQLHTGRPQHQYQLQAHQRSVSYSYGVTDTNDTVDSYVASRGSDGGFSQYPTRSRRNRRRSRPASDFTPNTSSSALGVVGQTGPATNRYWQQRQSPTTSPYGQQQERQGLGGGSPGYGFPANSQQGLDSRIHDLAEEQLFAGSSRPNFKRDAYDFTASSGGLPFNPWLSHQSGPHGTPPGFGAQAGGASRTGLYVHLTRDFLEGRVLIIDWAEPKGSVAGSTTGTADSSEPTYFHKKRRFIVAMTGPGHSFCLPIFTYANRGCLKNGVKPSQHGIIHAQDISPTLLDGEPSLGYDPVMMISDGPDTLRKESRINYAKPHTLEHNVKLRFIGHIREDQTASIQRNMFHAMQHHKLSMV